jgi:plasmid rolling circle replication initiator protein Rep
MIPIIPADTLSANIPQGNSWDKHRQETEKIEQLYRMQGMKNEEMKRYAERISTCSNNLEFEKTINIDTGEVTQKLTNGEFCHVRQCQICQWRRTLVWRRRFKKALPEITMAKPQGHWLFLTLTVENCEVSKLKDTLKAMNKGFNLLSRRKNWPGKGWIRSIEVTKSKSGKAHPHIHCLILVNKSYFDGNNYVSQAEWTRLWQESMRLEYKPVVHIRKVKLDKERAAKLKANNPEFGNLSAEDFQRISVEQAALETFKYSIKVEDLTQDGHWLAEITKQMHKTRSISLGGLIKKIMKEEEPSSEEFTADEEVLEGLLCALA